MVSISTSKRGSPMLKYYTIHIKYILETGLLNYFSPHIRLGWHCSNRPGRIDLQHANAGKEAVRESLLLPTMERQALSALLSISIILAQTSCLHVAAQSRLASDAS